MSRKKSDKKKKGIQKIECIRKLKPMLFTLCLLVSICGPGLIFYVDTVSAQTAQGELEGRPAPVALRPPPDRSVFTISVAVQFSASAAEITTIQNLISEASAMLFDVTDGQAEIGQAFIYNNAYSTGWPDADLRIYPSTSDTWWYANTGGWQVGGSMHVSMNRINAAVNRGESLAHEFIHLAFDARDEYQTHPNGPTGSASCPDAAAIAAGEHECLMDQGGLAGDHSELCWGHGDPLDLTDMTGGDHDATGITEQSMTRSGRSCWDQVVWAYPNSFQAPTGAPDPAAGGATVNPTQFVMPDFTTRVVLVLDESGSMSLESPSRMERLKVACLDFVALAEDDTELGIVSYSNDAEATSGRANVPIATLATNRATCNTAINNLSPDLRTNIGDGLYKAMDMIDDAGGVTANTFIVLMTDGLNNEPLPQTAADAHLQAAIDDLLDAGIPVYVTCTGSDDGLASQCSEIGIGTGGFYVDSANPDRLAETFADFHERISRRDQIISFATWENYTTPGLSVLDSLTVQEERGSTIYVEEGSESATFILQWHESGAKATFYMVDPNGIQHQSTGMAQGRFVRVANPVEGNWLIMIDWSGSAPADYMIRGYSRNQIHSLGAGVRYASVMPGEDIYIYAYPRSNGGSVTNPNQRIIGSVIRPDGSWDVIELNDMGHILPDGGDDIENDGVFTGVYSQTDLKGPYQFLLRADVDGWMLSLDREKVDMNQFSPHFVREVRVSAAVGDPNYIDPNPDDPPSGDKPDIFNWCTWAPWWLPWLLVLLLILLLIWCILQRRRRN